jgi:hypothetical protein
MRRVPVVQTAAVVLSMALLAACGSDSGDESPATASAPAPTTTSASGLVELPDQVASFQARIERTKLFPGASASAPPKVTRCVRADSGQTICLVEFVPGESATDRERIGSCEFVFAGADTPTPEVRLRLSKGPVGAAAACRRRAATLGRAVARTPIAL